MYVCTYDVRTYDARTYVPAYRAPVRRYVCMSVCMSVCLSVCMSVCLSACLPVCLYANVCMYVCMYAYMHACMVLQNHGFIHLTFTPSLESLCKQALGENIENAVYRQGIQMYEDVDVYTLVGAVLFIWHVLLGG